MVRFFALALLLPLSVVAQPRLEAVFEKVDSSVVVIRVAEKKVVSATDLYRVEVSVSTGSGVLLHPEGYIATAAHVVEDAEQIEVSFKNGDKVEGKVVTLSRSEDLALLKVDTVPKGITPVTLGNSDALKVGQGVFTIGTPLGFPHTLSWGVVSSIRNEKPRGLFPGHVIQTDAAINHGNSGGPLFNEKGEVVGIASHIASLSGGSEGLGFAVPANTVRRRLFEKPIPYMGMSLRHLPNPVMELFNWPYAAGMLVEKVKDESVAAKAGIRGGQVDALVEGTPVKLGGDLIVKVNDLDATQTDKIGEALAGVKEGDVVTYTVMRVGKLEEVKVTVPPRTVLPKLPKLK